MLLALALFHAALALGAPLAAYAWGGETEGRLPPRQQTGSMLLAPFIVAMAVVMLVRGRWLFPEMARELDWAVWAVFLFLVTQMFGALRSQGRQERRVMTPLYAIAAGLTAYVAFNNAGF